MIVADHRMPRMTGVEVLSKVRALSPRTVRILLTGYADLDAVEGSINESEVFRFLTKPCAPKQLRETIELAARLAREAPAPEAPELSPHDTLEIIMEADKVTEIGGPQSAHESSATRAPGRGPAARQHGSDAGAAIHAPGGIARHRDAREISELAASASSCSRATAK